MALSLSLSPLTTVHTLDTITPPVHLAGGEERRVLATTSSSIVMFFLQTIVLVHHHLDPFLDHFESAFTSQTVASW